MATDPRYIDKSVRTDKITFLSDAASKRQENPIQTIKRLLEHAEYMDEDRDHVVREYHKLTEGKLCISDDLAVKLWNHFQEADAPHYWEDPVMAEFVQKLKEYYLYDSVI